VVAHPRPALLLSLLVTAAAAVAVAVLWVAHAAPAARPAGHVAPPARPHHHVTVRSAAHHHVVPPPPHPHQPSVTLPVSSPWALPPMIDLTARRWSGRPMTVLERELRQRPSIALSPAARRSLDAGRVAPATLTLLLRVPRTGGPLLVFSLDGNFARVQETTLWMTRRAVRGLVELPPAERAARMLLEPVPTDVTDLKGPPPPRPGQLPTLVSLYRAAGYRYGIDWRILAAINQVETGYGRLNHVTSTAGAVGWMQFMPSTWRRWGVDASGDGVADPYNPTDAIYSAARYLNAAGGTQDIRRGLFAYNHATWYVNEVVQIAERLPADYGTR
jgi:Transglycosylase SLT domain